MPSAVYHLLEYHCHKQRLNSFLSINTTLSYGFEPSWHGLPVENTGKRSPAEGSDFICTSYLVGWWSWNDILTTIWFPELYSVPSLRRDFTTGACLAASAVWARPYRKGPASQNCMMLLPEPGRAMINLFMYGKATKCCHMSTRGKAGRIQRAGNHHKWLFY